MVSMAERQRIRDNIDTNLAWSRVPAAEVAYQAYDFSDHDIRDVGHWTTVGQSSCSYPDRTLKRVLKLNWQDRTYCRVFSVVFAPDTYDVIEISFGDFLP